MVIALLDYCLYPALLNFFTYFFHLDLYFK